MRAKLRGNDPLPWNIFGWAMGGMFVTGVAVVIMGVVAMLPEFNVPSAESVAMFML